MDPSLISSLTGAQNLSRLSSAPGISGLSGLHKPDSIRMDSSNGTMFEAILNTAIGNIKTTNSYLSDAEDEEIRFALGESDSTHDLTIALEKASTALQYTVAIRNKVLDAYKELMQIQI